MSANPEQLTENGSCKNVPSVGVTKQLPNVGDVAVCNV